MTIPSYIVIPGVLGMFKRARELFSVEPGELLVVMVVSMTEPGQAINVDHLRLLTGGERKELVASLVRLKTLGFLDQLGAHYSLTSRGKELMWEVNQS